MLFVVVRRPSTCQHKLWRSLVTEFIDIFTRFLSSPGVVANPVSDEVIFPWHTSCIGLSGQIGVVPDSNDGTIRHTARAMAPTRLYRHSTGQHVGVFFWNDFCKVYNTIVGNAGEAICRTLQPDIEKLMNRRMQTWTSI